MSDMKWAKLKVLVEKAAKLNFMTPKQTEILEMCIARKEHTVLSVLSTSGGNFTKVYINLSLTLLVCSIDVSHCLGLLGVVHPREAGEERSQETFS
jgi:hypothetical protein